MNWKILSFDHEVKTKKVIWSLSIFFWQVKFKELVIQKNMRLKSIVYITPMDLQLFKIYSIIFLNEFRMWFFLEDLVYLKHLTLENQDLQWTSLHKILNRKIILIYFQNWIFDAKTRLQKELFKNLNY